MKLILALLFLMWLPGLQAFAQPQNHRPLTIEKIMQAPEKWIGTQPDQIFWNETSDVVYFDWNPEQDTLSSRYSFSLKNGSTTKVPAAEKVRLPEERGIYDAGFGRKVEVRNGNLFWIDLKKGRERQLTDFAGRVSQPAFTAGGKVSFVYHQNLFWVDPETGLISQLTDFVAGEAPAGSRQTWLEKQQQQLFDVLRERDRLQKIREYRQTTEDAAKPEKIFLGKERLGNVWLAPTGKYVVFTTFENQPGRETSVTHFVTESGYTEGRSARAKVGAAPAAVKLVVWDRAANQLLTVQTDSLPGVKELPDFWNDYPEKRPAAGKISPRAVSFSALIWNKTLDLALVSVYSRDNKDRWVCLLDPVTGQLELLDRQRDGAWIGGPGISNWGQRAGWLPDNETVWFQSEESGYSHLVTVNIRNKDRRALTAGRWEVYEPFLSRDEKFFYFTANLKHPGIRHFYRLPAGGGQPVQITQADGGNEVTLSPDEKWLAIRHSTANRPWELYLQENKPGAQPRKITHSLSPEFESYPWRMPRFVTFEAADGETVYARLYRPEQPAQQGPAVIFVHGAGYLQNAHQWWSSYSREYLFHNLLVDHGYTVLDIDYRGSAGYGRDWRTGIYRHMGGKDLSDHLDGVRFLTEKCGVSPSRIGIYGGSYGGFITLMALFKHPGVFAAGAALRAVTDWAHYNHGYTANILNTPAEDSLAFVRSSPIYFADGLNDALLMCHGMVDDNVQFQDIVRLSQRLIELGKQNWELAVYPVESHGFVEPSSWTDEYRRIFKLFEENLKK